MTPSPLEPADAHPAPDPTPLGPGRELVLVAAGGMIGALARAGVATSIETSLASFALSTLLVNGLGAFALGLFLAFLERRGPRPALRSFLAVGLLGSFTTFSTLVDESGTAAAAHSHGLALALFALSLAIGLLAYQLGSRLGIQLDRCREEQRGRQ